MQYRFNINVLYICAELDIKKQHNVAMSIAHNRTDMCKAANVYPQMSMNTDELDVSLDVSHFCSI